MSKEVAIEKINICRLIFKLQEQLGDSSPLTPQLRQELVIAITELKKQQHTERVRKVVDQYYTKYTAAVAGKVQRPILDFKEKALQIILGLEAWPR